MLYTHALYIQLNYKVLRTNFLSSDARALFVFLPRCFVRSPADRPYRSSPTVVVVVLLLRFLFFPSPVPFMRTTSFNTRCKSEDTRDLAFCCIIAWEVPIVSSCIQGVLGCERYFRSGEKERELKFVENYENFLLFYIKI